MQVRLIEIFVASVLLGATSLFSRLVVWMPGGMRTRWLPWLQAVAVGLLIGDSLLHLLPHALGSHDDLSEIMLAFVIGATFLALVENVVRTRRIDGSAVAPAARMTLASDFIHHSVDGIILAGAFLASRAAGFAALVAIAIHEIPREIASAGVLVSNGYDPRRAFFLSLAMALAVPAGALAVAATLPSENAAALTAAFAAGSILYVALADILPAAWLQANGSARLAPAIGIAAGVVSMWLLARGERA